MRRLWRVGLRLLRAFRLRHILRIDPIDLDGDISVNPIRISLGLLIVEYDRGSDVDSVDQPRRGLAAETDHVGVFRYRPLLEQDARELQDAAEAAIDAPRGVLALDKLPAGYRRLCRPRLHKMGVTKEWVAVGAADEWRAILPITRDATNDVRLVDDGVRTRTEVEVVPDVIEVRARLLGPSGLRAIEGFDR